MGTKAACRSGFNPTPGFPDSLTHPRHRRVGLKADLRKTASIANRVDVSDPAQGGLQPDAHDGVTTSVTTVATVSA